MIRKPSIYVWYHYGYKHIIRNCACKYSVLWVIDNLTMHGQFLLMIKFVSINIKRKLGIPYLIIKKIVYSLGLSDTLLLTRYTMIRFLIRIKTYINAWLDAFALMLSLSSNILISTSYHLVGSKFLLSNYPPTRQFEKPVNNIGLWWWDSLVSSGN